MLAGQQPVEAEVQCVGAGGQGVTVDTRIHVRYKLNGIPDPRSNSGVTRTTLWRCMHVERSAGKLASGRL